ncbi:adenine methyltransferase [Elizabethkingia anophelis]|nr:adenine methyltransferase [Elizabethkingia anophelis]
METPKQQAIKAAYGRKGIGSHQSANMMKDEWLTPPEIIKALGSFDLDPCSPINRPWSTADNHYTIENDGLSQEWKGRVWCNPPYGLEAAKWLDKLSIHRNGIALIFARTETKMFFDHVWNKADAVLFLEGRLYFHHVDGTRARANAGAPSVLIAYGKENVETLKNCSIKGKFITL